MAKSYASWLLALAWMAVIFAASSDSMSFQHSSRIIGPLVHLLFPQLSDATIHTIIVFIRKGAHVTEYAILALLVWRALHQTRTVLTHSASPAGEFQAWRWPHAFQAALIVLLYASTDEFHQRFVPSREASVTDVLLDTTGGVLALLFLWGIGRWRKRW